MIGVIPNPTKKITINYPINKVKESVVNIPNVLQFCHFRECNEVFNTYTFSRNEFLSAGVFIDVTLTPVDNRCEVEIVVRRKIGAFDEWVEVQKANKHIEEFMNTIGSILTNGVPLKQQVNKVKPELTFGDAVGALGGLVVVGVMIFYGIKLGNYLISVIF